jgi:hypothetical protein
MIEATIENRGKTIIFRHYHVSFHPVAPSSTTPKAVPPLTCGERPALDVVFDEDRARNRKDHAPENLATLRKLALNVLNRARPDISVRRKRKRSGWSNDFARSILGQMR